MPAVIDHTAYPGILDLIIAYAPVASLFKLASTSTQCRERLAPLLAKHVVVIAEGRQRAPALYVPKGLRCDDRENWRAHFRPDAIQVLDVDDYLMHNNSYLRKMARGLTSLRVLRRFNRADNVGGSPISPPGVHTAVDYVAIFPTKDGDKLRPSLHCFTLPNLQRHVIHVRWGQHQLNRSQMYWPKVVWDRIYSLGFSGPKISEVVIVLWPDIIWYNNIEGTEAIGVPTLLATLANVPYNTERLVIVGLEDVADPELADDLAWSTRKKAIFDDIEAKRQLKSPDFQLHTMTREEWWAGLAPGEKDVVGTWYAESECGRQQ